MIVTKTEWQIKMDFKKAMAAVNNLRKIANKLDDNNDDFGGVINLIDNNWDGENSEKFIGKGRTIQGKISETSAGIRKTADAIEDIAKRLRDAELNAIRIARD
ncbi:WXG100 family type VII secretion target [Butyrivibrio sp. YAB3001]|uniref:WXG100 family type VII secretion target n=1 Tax=Butyrivibrio sp. YAB3001 TaxID=1520812 RepID=UPI0008F6706D|nr:WXG100 family type VII secretion target [Butyrivibrio sp. YAB3001]SFB82416.1 Proteins of 100 residues with WXG [Butyrivibrio sp. YAB3001]